MAKKINFKRTSDTVKNAMINFYDGYVKFAQAGKDFRDAKKVLDAKFETDKKAIENKRNAETDKKKKEKLANELGQIIGNYDVAVESLKKTRKQAEKEGKSLYKPAYDLLIPCDDSDVYYKKSSEESRTLHSAYVYYQKTNDFTQFSDLFKQFLTGIGYESIANDVAYQTNTARIFEVRLGSTAAKSNDLLNGQLVSEMSPAQFNKLFLMIFYGILKDNKVFDSAEAPKTEAKAE